MKYHTMPLESLIERRRETIQAIMGQAAKLGPVGVAFVLGWPVLFACTEILARAITETHRPWVDEE